MLFFLFSNMLMLPLYYCSEKQDFRGVASYLATQLRDGDRVFLSSSTYIAGLLHYFRVYPEGRHYDTTFRWIDSGKVFETAVSVTSQNQTWDLVHSNVCCSQFLANQNRLWILAGKEAGREIVKDSPCVLKGYFDGRFSHFRRYPSDASMVLFLWDPQATGKKGNSPPLQP